MPKEIKVPINIALWYTQGMNLPIEKLWGFILEESCWVWPKVNKSLGYGWISKGHSERFYAHRVFYHYFVDDLKEDMTLDHLCRNRACVNPEHLEQVTLAENKRRGDSPAAIQARKTHCKKGHLLTDKGNGHRHCRPCHLEYMYSYNRRNKNG